jgi:hypothetical protein
MTANMLSSIFTIDILDQLNDARSLPPNKRSQEITTIVDGQLSRIHRIMCYVPDKFAATHTGPLADRIVSVLKGIVKIEALPRPAFGEHGQAVFLESRAAFVRIGARRPLSLPQPGVTSR